MNELQEYARWLHVQLDLVKKDAAQYENTTPLILLDQVDNYQQAIALTEQAIRGELSKTEWRAAIMPLLSRNDTSFGESSSVFIRDVERIDRSTFVGRDFVQTITNFFSSDPSHVQDLRNKLVLLKKVKDFWIEGVLERSVHSELIKLHKTELAEAVEHPWDIVVQTPDREDRSLPPEQKIIDLFDEMGRALLILGEPGSGKTITLLELAQDAIVEAEKALTQPFDPTRPIASSPPPVPVVFNLSSWAERRQRLVDWLVYELNTKYQIPKRIGRSWVENNELMLLLDGLDEVDSVHRVACVEAINRFRHEIGFGDLVVCSRVTEYEALTTRLKLQGAILLQPLTLEQIDRYLAADPKLVGLQTALRHDSALQELAHSPLMLSIMGLAYYDSSTQALDKTKFQSIEERRNHIFAAYIKGMFKRRRADQSFSAEQTVGWLTWVARKMSQHKQSVLMLERIQPTWLSTLPHLWRYIVSTRLMGTLLIGLAFTLLFISLQRWPEYRYNHIISFLFSYLAAGVVVALIDGAYFTQQNHQDGATMPISKSQHPIINMVIMTFGVTMAFGLTLWMTISGNDTTVSQWVDTINSYIFGSSKFSAIFLFLLFSLFLAGLPVGLIFGLRKDWQNRSIDIQTVETLSWSWRGFFSPIPILSLILAGATFAVTTVIHDPGVIVWDRDGKIVAKLNGHSGRVNTAEFSPDGSRVVTAGKDGKAILWKWENGAKTVLLSDQEERAELGLFSPDGNRILIITQSGKAQLREGLSGIFIAQLAETVPVAQDGTFEYFNKVNFSPDGSRILTINGNGNIKLWDSLDGTFIRDISNSEPSVNFGIFSQDGTQILTAGSGVAKVWDTYDGTLIASTPNHGDIETAAFSPDGHQFATSAWSTIRLWNSIDGTLIAEFNQPGGANSINFSPDGTRIITAHNDGTAKLWDGNDGALITTLTGHTHNQVNQAQFNPDGSRIVTISRDNTARLWNGYDGTLIATMSAHNGAVFFANYSPDGSWIITTSTAPDYRILSAFWLLLGLIFALLNGLRSNVRPTKTSPNQGIWLSARYAVVIGAVVGLIFALTTWSIFSIGFTPPLDRFFSDSLVWSPLLLISLFAFFWILGALWYGGMDVIQHFILRFILFGKRNIPFAYVRFLDYAAERILLRKVGGGYIFIHRLLLEHFAAMESKQEG